MAPARAHGHLRHHWLGRDHRGLSLRRQRNRANRPAHGAWARMTRPNRHLLEQFDRIAVSHRLTVASVSTSIRDEPERTEIAEQLVSLVAPDSFAADQYRTLRHSVERLRK